MYPYQKHIKGIDVSTDGDALSVDGVLFPPKRVRWMNPFALLSPKTVMGAFSKRPIRVQMLTSVGRCGIAEYTKSLIQHMPKWIEVDVFDKTLDLFSQSNALLTRPETLIHIQYEPGLWSSQLDRQRLEIAKRWECKKVITAHYYDGWLAKNAKYFDIVIVHDQRFAAPANHRYIVQGCPVAKAKDVSRLRARFRIPDDAIVLASFGFYMDWKRLDYLFEQIAPYLAKDNRLYLFWMHSIHPKAFEHGQKADARVRRLIDVHRLTDRVWQSSEFLSTGEINDRLQAADIGFLWASDSPSRGSSAVSKTFVSGRCPLVATAISHYGDLDRGVLFVPADAPIQTFIYWLLSTATNKNLLSHLRDEQAENYKALNYDVFARKNVGCYMEAIYGS